MNRRKFMGNLGVTLVSMAGSRTLMGKSLFGQESAEEIYKRSYVTDAMCFSADPWPTYLVYFSNEKVEALRTSGITAIGLCMMGRGSNPGDCRFTRIKNVIEEWDAFVKKHPDVFLKITDFKLLQEAKRSGKVGLIYNFQGISSFGWDLNRMELFVDMGVRQIGLSHDRRNQAVDSCYEKTNAGLSAYGNRLIEALNEQRVIVDLTHVGDRSGLEAIISSKAPVIFSHSGCYPLCPHPRNVSDRNIKMMADRGGVFCVYDQSAWLTKDPDISIDHYLAHVEHVINIGGEDHVGVGMDQDAVDMTAMRSDEVERHQAKFDRRVKEFPQLTWKVKHMRVPELSHPKRLLHIAQALKKRGYKARTIEKIIGGNYVRVFKEVVG